MRRVLWILCVLLTTTLRAEDWPQWRGPERTGVTKEPSGYPNGWPPKTIWSVNVGRGATSPIMANGKVFVMGWQGPGKDAGTDAVFCFDAATGKQLWRQTYRSRYYGRHAVGDKGSYGGPNSTPAYDAKTDFLFTLGIDGDLGCWDVARDGRPVWSKNLYDEFRVPQRPAVGKGDTGQRDFGFCSSPLLYDGHVIVDVGGPAGLVIGFDVKTGAARWRSESKELAGSNSGPALIRVDGVDCVASLGLKALVVTRIDKGNEGRTVAQVPWETTYACNIATPAVLGDRVAVTSAYSIRRTGLFVLSVKRTGGSLKSSWSVGEHATVSSPVLHDGSVFLPEGSLRCLDLATGKLKWRVGALGNGSCIVAGDGKVIAHGKGRLLLVDEKTGKELGSAPGVPSGWPSIAFSDGIILCKDDAGRVTALSAKTDM